MAKYSYTSGMEARGLEWIWIPIIPNTAPKAGTSSNYMKTLQGAISTFYAAVPISNAAAQQIVILENLIVPNGAGTFLNAILFYNPADPRRLPGDNIRFHDGAQDLGIKFIEPPLAQAPAPVTYPSLSNDPLFMDIGRLSRFVTNSSPELDVLPVGTVVTVYNAAGQSVSKTIGSKQFDTPVVGQTRVNFLGTWAQNYSQAAGGYFLV